MNIFRMDLVVVLNFFPAYSITLDPPIIPRSKCSDTFYRALVRSDSSEMSGKWCHCGVIIHLNLGRSYSY